VKVQKTFFSLSSLSRFANENETELKMQISENTDTEVLQETVETEVRSLVVFNDDVNTFDWVIDTLVEVCGHTPQQAEQCTIIIHFKGKCSVKDGSYEELAEMRNSICNRGISAEVL
jgi:ATP-dependent Clp protease adaptor protein ClpS